MHPLIVVMQSEEQRRRLLENYRQTQYFGHRLQSEKRRVKPFGSVLQMFGIKIKNKG